MLLMILRLWTSSQSDVEQHKRNVTITKLEAEGDIISRGSRRRSLVYYGANKKFINIEEKRCQ
jgi:hypothetical protein